MKTQPPGEFYAIGRVLGSWGREGLLKVYPLTDFPEKIPKKRDVWLWREDAGTRKAFINGGRLSGGVLVLGLEGVGSIDQAESLKGFLIMVDEENLERLPEGVYYHHEIIGLEVESEEGIRLGTVEEIWPTGAHDIYVIREGKKELLIPAVKEHVLKINKTEGIMVVRTPSDDQAKKLR